MCDGVFRWDGIRLSERNEKSRSTNIEGGLLNILDDIVDMGLATSFDDVGQKRALVTKTRPEYFFAKPILVRYTVKTI